MGPGGFILLTAPSLLCIENTVFPFRWRDDGREKGSGGGAPRTVPATDFKLQNLGPHLFTKKESERQTVRREGMRDQEEKKGRQEKRREGRKKTKQQQRHKGVRN